MTTEQSPGLDPSLGVGAPIGSPKSERSGKEASGAPSPSCTSPGARQAEERGNEAGVASSAAHAEVAAPFPELETIEIKLHSGRIVAAVIVPGTGGTLAIDERYPATTQNPAGCAISHVPTSLRVARSPETDALCWHRALIIAQRIYLCAKELDVDLASKDGDAIAKKINEHRVYFWRKVAGR
jgi:hypothetical protein